MKKTSKTIPELRFPEFDAVWELKKISEIALGKLTNGVFNDPKKVGKGYYLINVKDMYLGDYIDKSLLTQLDINESEFKKNKVIYGDVFFTRSSLVKEGIAKSAVNLNKDNDITFDGHLVKLTPNPEIVNSMFLGFILKTESARKELVARGKTGTMTTIGQADISTVYVSYPSLPEQTKIANFLSLVDVRIRKLTEKRTLLEQYKKGIMQKLFSQQLRFKDENGNDFADWETKTLSKIGKNSIGLTYTPNDVVKTDGFIVLRSTNIKNKRLVLDDTVRVNVDLKPDLKIRRGDILICTRNGSQRLIGKNILIDDSVAPLNFTFGAFMSVFRSEYNDFLFHLFQTDLYKKQIHKNLGARINQITTGNLNKFKFSLPSLSEQRKIANFLSAVDTRIDLINQQIEENKRYKKGLLQQMFI